MDKGLLNDATSTDDSPTPGYMLNEIARSTLANYTACLQLEEYLCTKLAKNNHNSKYKCLVIIKHVCRAGRVDFKKDMCKHVNVVKECLQYKGPPDPLRGDEIYRRVRDAAKEVLDVLFDSTMPVTTSSVAASNRIQGFGSSYTGEEEGQNSGSGGGSGKSYFKSVTSAISNAMSAGVGADGTTTKYSNYNPEASAANPLPNNPAVSPHMHSNSYNGAASVNNRHSSPSPVGGSGGNRSSSGMTGIGNPNFKDPRDESSNSSMSNYISKASSYLSGGASGANSSSGGQTRGPTLGEISYNNTGASGASDYNFASNRGVYNPSSSGNSAGAWQNGQGNQSSKPQESPAASEPAASVPSGPGKAGTAATDGSYETNLVADLVQPSGMKVAIPQESAPVQNFLRCAVTLSADTIGSCLAGYLSVEEGNSTPWQSRVKSLMLLGYLVAAPGCDHHRQWWVNGTGHQFVSSLCAAPDSPTVKPLVRAQAVKTLDAMGFDVSMYGSVASAAPVKRGSVRVSSASPKPGGAGALAATSGAAPASGGGGVDLLGDLTDSGPSPQQAQAQAAPSAPSPQHSPSAPAVAPAPDITDIFAGMSVGAPAPAHAAEAAPAAQQSPSVSAATPSSMPAPGPVVKNFDVFDLLDDSNLPPAAPQQQPQQQNTPQDEGSVFSFLGGAGGGANAGTAPAHQSVGGNYNNNRMGGQMGYGGQGQGIGGGMGNNAFGGMRGNMGGMGLPSNSMTSITSERKVIPTDSALSSTVFGGTNNMPRPGMQHQQQQYRGGSNATPKTDSFNFVQDAMKGKPKK